MIIIIIKNIGIRSYYSNYLTDPIMTSPPSFQDGQNQEMFSPFTRKNGARESLLPQNTPNVSIWERHSV